MKGGGCQSTIIYTNPSEVIYERYMYIYIYTYIIIQIWDDKILSQILSLIRKGCLWSRSPGWCSPAPETNSWEFTEESEEFARDPVDGATWLLCGPELPCALRAIKVLQLWLRKRWDEEMKMWVCLKILCTPKPNGFADHYPVFKWLFHWEYTQHFQTNPCCNQVAFETTCSWQINSEHWCSGSQLSLPWLKQKEHQKTDTALHLQDEWGKCRDWTPGCHHQTMAIP